VATRFELEEATLEHFPEGVAILGSERELIFWNRAAEQATGFPSIEVINRPIPSGLEPLLIDQSADSTRPRQERGQLIHANHRCGRELSFILRDVVLRNALGTKIGNAIIFRLADRVNFLAHGESAAEADLEAALREIEEQARSAYADFVEAGVPLGLL
jgi:PAS domain S-box-containing protein